MTRRASIIAYCLVILVVLLGLQSWSIALGQMEQRVVAAIEQRTGLLVTERGKAEFALLPLPRVSLSNVVFRQREGDVSGSALRMRARVRLLPLLAGSFGFDRIELVAPQIDVAVPEAYEGIGDWLAPPLGWLERLQVQSRIVVSGGSVFMRAQGAIQSILRDVNLVLEGRSAAEPLALSGSLTWRGVPSEVSLLWPMAGERGRLSLGVTSALMNLQFDGARAGPGDPVVTGKLALTTKALPELLGWFGEKPRLASTIGAFGLAADAQIKHHEASLSNVVARLDGERLDGAIKLGDAGGRLSVSGTLAGAELDLGRLIARLDLARAAQPGEQAVPLDFEAWTAQDVDLRISAEAARVAGAKLDDVATYLLVKKGRFEAGLLRSSVYGGSAKGRLLALAAPGGIDVKLQAGLDKVNLGKAGADLPDLARLSGTGGLQLTLDGIGQTPAEIVASLSGKAGLGLRQGELSGFAFAELLRRLERNPRLVLRDWRQGKTPFDAASVNLTIANGIASVADGAMTGASYRLGLSGTLSLPERWFEMQAVLAPTSGTPQLPFSLRGPLDNPAFELDSEALLRPIGASTAPALLLR